MRRSPAIAADPHAGTFLQLVYEKLPLFVIAAGAAGITFIASHSTSALVSTASISISHRLANALVACAAYLAKALVPRNLAVFYPPPATMPRWQPVAALALIALLTFIVIRAKKRPYLLVGWLWFLGMLLPVSGIFQNGRQFMADRYAYFSFIGIFIAVVWLIADLAAHLRVPAWSEAAVVALLLMVLVPITRKQLSYWHEGITLFAHALAVTRDNDVAEDNLGVALASAGFINESMPHFEQALALSPYDPIARFDYGTYLLRTGRPQLAVAQLRIALAETPNQFVQREICDNLGAALASSGDLKNAGLSYALAIELDPADSVATRGLEMVNAQANFAPPHTAK
jgi:tetratricopeptide (TPR) repeat protein